MKVSILVPVYKVEKYIEQCARSLFEQSYPHCEFIFVSDGSPDNSVAILRSVAAQYSALKSQIKIIELAQNGGVAAARNAALDAATGEFILFVDADDWVDRYIVERLVERAAMSGADICNAWCVSVGEGIFERVATPWIGSKRSHLRALLAQSHIVANHVRGMLIARSLFESHGLRFTPGIDFGEDYSLLPQLLYHATRLDTLSQYLYFYRLSNQSSYMNNIGQHQILSYLAAQRVVSTFVGSLPDAALFRGAIIRGRLNIKKWIFKRRVLAQSFDEQLFDDPSPRFTSPLLSLYNRVINSGNPSLVFAVSVIVNSFTYIKSILYTLWWRLFS